MVKDGPRRPRPTYDISGTGNRSSGKLSFRIKKHDSVGFLNENTLSILQLFDNTPIFLPLEISYFDESIKIEWFDKSIELTKYNLKQIVTSINLDYL